MKSRSGMFLAIEAVPAGRGCLAQPKPFVRAYPNKCARNRCNGLGGRDHTNETVKQTFYIEFYL